MQDTLSGLSETHAAQIAELEAKARQAVERADSLAREMQALQSVANEAKSREEALKGICVCVCVSVCVSARACFVLGWAGDSTSRTLLLMLFHLLLLLFPGDAQLHAQLARDAANNYERELMLHASTVKNLNEVKQQLGEYEERIRANEVCTRTHRTPESPYRYTSSLCPLDSKGLHVRQVFSPCSLFFVSRC